MTSPPAPAASRSAPPPERGSRSGTVPGAGASAGSTGPAGGESALPPEDLLLLETELARHIGPLARVLVKKAAKGAGNMSHVITKCELEIESDDARRAFRAAVKKLR
jgi:serine/threonine-protein kinase